MHLWLSHGSGLLSLHYRVVTPPHTSHATAVGLHLLQRSKASRRRITILVFAVCLHVLLLLHAAAELERRYREGQAVYEEVMLHRPPGVCCTDITSTAVGCLLQGSKPSSYSLQQ